MNEEVSRESLLKELHELNEKIASFGLSESERKLERIDLLHKYNDTKDHAQRILGALAELEGVSTSVLYKKMKINFE